MVRAGVAKILDYCYRGGYEAKDFPPGRMRSWIGAAENERGHAFNRRVAGRLNELGWETRSDIKLTAILGSRLVRDYGDVDVFAWKGKRVLAIECKDLEMAMTNSDIARQLHDFRGELAANGKPDRTLGAWIRHGTVRRVQQRGESISTTRKRSEWVMTYGTGGTHPMQQRALGP